MIGADSKYDTLCCWASELDWKIGLWKLPSGDFELRVWTTAPRRSHRAWVGDTPTEPYLSQAAEEVAAALDRAGVI